MKIFIIIFFVMAALLWSCEQPEANAATHTATVGTTSSVLVLKGNKIDTAYLYATYKDPGAGVYAGGMQRCPEFEIPEITGSVNTRLPGIYTLTYSAKDAAGNLLTPLTRTVHVVENSAGFLNGIYDVACTCTAGVPGSPNPTITTESYTATIASGSTNHHFELMPLRIGPEKVIPSAWLNGNSIGVSYFSPDYARSSGSGTLSATKTTFTIENTMYPFAPALTYICKSVYTKQLIIK